MRFDLEYSFRKTDMLSDNFNGLGGLSGTKNEVTYHSILFNVSYDWFLYENIFWYTGLGLGVSFVQIHSTDNFDDTNAEVAYQFKEILG